MARTTTSRKETGTARVRRLMREQRCHGCEGLNPDISIPQQNGKVKHYHMTCR